MLNIHEELPPCLFFSLYEMYNDYGAIKRTRDSCFFSHALFRRYLREIFLLENARISRNVCKVWPPGGPKSRRPHHRRIRMADLSSSLAFSTYIAYFAAQISRCAGLTYGTFRVSLKKEGARPSSNNAATWRRVSSKSCSDGPRDGLRYLVNRICVELSRGLARNEEIKSARSRCDRHNDTRRSLEKH